MATDRPLPTSDFLGNMDPSDRKDLLACAQVAQYERGQHVFQCGAPGRNVYVLESGRAKIYKLADSGKEVILWFCFPGEIFGLAEAPRGTMRQVYAQACARVRVHVISRDDFSAYLASHPKTAMQVIDLLSCRMRVLGDMLLNLVSDDVGSRIIKLLIRLAAHYGRRTEESIDLELPLTHQEMADMVGTTRQTVTTVLGELRRRGLLSMEHHHMQIRCEHLINSLGTATSDVELRPR